MKIGQNTTSSLLEQMQQAHTDAAKAAAPRPSFAAVAPDAVGGASAAGAASAPPLQASVSQIAGRVISGDIKSPEVARVAVLHAIIEDRWGDKLSPPQLRQVSKSLEQNLADDPTFMREVDEMLILAALELGKR